MEAVAAQEQEAVADLKLSAAEVDAEVTEMQTAAKSHHDNGPPSHPCALAYFSLPTD